MSSARERLLARRNRHDDGLDPDDLGGDDTSSLDDDDDPPKPPARRAVAVEVESVNVQAVVGGCLMDIRLGAGTDPGAVHDWLKSIDPNVKVRESFPMGKSFGARETKSATAIVVNARVTDSGKFIDITCTSGEDDLTVQVSKKKADQFPDDLAALGKLAEHDLSKLRKAFDDKGTCTIVLREESQFTVKYWTTDDGKAFLDSLEAAVAA